MWKGTLIGFILPLGCHSGCVVEKGGRAGKGDYWMDWITVMLLSAFGFLGRGRLESVEDLRLPLAGYIGLES